MKYEVIICAQHSVQDARLKGNQVALFHMEDTKVVCINQERRTADLANLNTDDWDHIFWLGSQDAVQINSKMPDTSPLFEEEA